MSNLSAHPVRVERERQNLTLDALAEKAGVSVRSLSRAESFQALREESKQKIAAALNVNVNDLWSEVRIGSIIAGPDGAYQVAATASDGSLIISPVSFGPNEVVSAAEIKQRFGVTVQTATQPQRNGWRSLAEASRANALSVERVQAQASAAQAEVNKAEAQGWNLFVETHTESVEASDV